MAMTLQNIIDLIPNLTQFDLDNFNGSSPTTQQLVDLANWAARTISRKLFQYDHKIAFTLTGSTSSYSLRGNAFTKKVLWVHRVYISNAPLSDARENYGLWTVEELDAEYPSWRSPGTGTPTFACQTAESLILYPTPSSAGSGNYVAGRYLVPNLTTSDLSSSYDIPEELHECIAYIAAIKASLPMASEEEAWRRLDAYNSSWREMCEAIAIDQYMSVFGHTRGIERFGIVGRES